MNEGQTEFPRMTLPQKIKVKRKRRQGKQKQTLVILMACHSPINVRHLPQTVE